MHNNFYWYVLIAIIALSVFWFVGKFSYAYYKYAALNAKAPVETIEWSVEGLTDEKYVLKGRYTFKIHGESQTGETTLFDRHYWNSKAAASAIPEYSSKNWTVWYQAHNPSHSSLQKYFPLKELLYTFILIGLLAYFIWLGFYASTFRN